MRSAAYCSECNGYVWLDQRGDCMYGHPSFYLRDVHKTETLPTPVGSPQSAASTQTDQQDSAAPTDPATSEMRNDVQDASALQPNEVPGGVPPGPTVPPQHPDQPYPPYGYGQQYPGQYSGQHPDHQPMPGQPYPPDPHQQAQIGPSGLPWGVPRFNWAAFLLPVIWPLVYGVPMYAGIALAANVIANATFTFLPAISLPVSLAALGVDIWVGFAAHKAFWKRYPTKMTVAEYRVKQVKWVVVGAVILILLFGCSTLASVIAITGQDPASFGL